MAAQLDVGCRRVLVELIAKIGELKEKKVFKTAQFRATSKMQAAASHRRHTPKRLPPTRSALAISKRE